MFNLNGSDEAEDIWSDRPEEAQSGFEGDEVSERSFASQRRNAIVNSRQKQQPVYEEEYEEETPQDTYEFDHAQKLTIGEAKLKLEQAKLYEMIIGFDMFSEVRDIHPDAILAVKEELKNFLVDRLEVLLGMKEESGSTNYFTAMEVKALKEVAKKITNSYQTRENVYSAREEEEEEFEAPPQGGLRKMGAPKPAPQRVEKPAYRAPTPVAKPNPRPELRQERQEVRQEAKAPLRKSASIAPKPNAPKPPIPKRLQKSIDEMSEDELIERNKMITAGQTAKSVRDNSKPMPSFDQELGMHQSNTNSNPQLSNMMTILRTATRV